MKNVLVTGAATTLGRAVLRHLATQDGVEHVVGVEPSNSSDWVDGAELVAFPTEHREFVSLLCEHPIDTVIHCHLAPDRNGSTATPTEARVIETMRLGAALASPEVSVRAWAIASSSRIYPVDCQTPLLLRENTELDSSQDPLPESLREAEEYARDVAERRPHLNVSLLRLQHLVGPGVRSPMTALLGQPVLPRPVGYNGAIQMLALDDAVRALAFAAKLELAGVYNVASVGTTRMSEIVRVLGKPSLPVIPLEAPSALEGLVRRFGVPHVPEGMLDALRFGHALDTSKLAAAGFEPEHDQDTCLDMLRAAD